MAAVTAVKHCQGCCHMWVSDFLWLIAQTISVSPSIAFSLPRMLSLFLLHPYTNKHTSYLFYSVILIPVFSFILAHSFPSLSISFSLSFIRTNPNTSASFLYWFLSASFSIEKCLFWSYRVMLSHPNPSLGPEFDKSFFTIIIIK